MSVVRGTSMSGYPSLVAELGGDPTELLRAAGIRPQDVGQHEVFLPYRNLIVAVETAAAATSTPDFGRRLALRQGIEILGPLGVAARTAATVGDAFAIVETFLAAYSPAISARITPSADAGQSFYAFEVLIERPPPHPQTTELSLGVSLRVLRFLLGAHYTPLTVHLPHQPLTDTADYLTYFGCRPCFTQPAAGFTFRTADLARSLNQDALVLDRDHYTPTRHDPVGAHHGAPTPAHRHRQPRVDRRPVRSASQGTAPPADRGEDHLRQTHR
jgi:hypothetical protein